MNLEVIRDMILGTVESTLVNIHTVKKIKREREGGGGAILIVSEHEYKL